jgi:hypothetical protein
MSRCFVANTTSALSGKTLLLTDTDATVTALHTFNRGSGSAPLAVGAGAANVSNLDADKVDGKHASAFAGVAETETVSGTWSFSAKPNINAGLQFPAVQVASADANTLDDYEEGSWTPTITSSGGGTPTYTTQVARYVKVGKNVTIYGRLTLATKGTLAAGSIKLASLPFTTDATVVGGLSINYFGNVTGASNLVQLGMFTDTAATTANIYHATNAAGQAAMASTQVSDVNTTFDIIFAGNYLASA